MFGRIKYEIRWWKWFLFGNLWPVRTLYMGKYKLDHDSRHVILDRLEKEWEAAEPRYEGKARWTDSAGEEPED